MDLKQIHLSDCSSDKYTESRMKDNVFQKKKKKKTKTPKSLVVSPTCAGKFMLFYLGTNLTAATS